MRRPKLILLYVLSVLIYSCTTTTIPIEEEAGPITELITYNADVKVIIDTNCVGCHGSVSPQAGLSLVTYQQVRSAAENGNLIARMNNPLNPMPQGGLLDTATRAVIDKWADDGFLEN